MTNFNWGPLTQLLSKILEMWSLYISGSISLTSIQMEFIKNIQLKSQSVFNENCIKYFYYTYLGWFKLSVLGFIFDKDRCNSFCTSQYMYLVARFVSNKNTVLHKYFVAEICSTLPTFSYNDGYSETKFGGWFLFKLYVHRCVQVTRIWWFNRK